MLLFLGGGGEDRWGVWGVERGGSPASDLWIHLLLPG